MHISPDVEGIAANLNAEYHDNVFCMGGVPIPGIAKPGKEEQFDKFRELVHAMAAYLELAAPEFHAAKFFQSVYR